MKKTATNTDDSGSPQGNSLCAVCPANELNLCHAVIKASWEYFDRATALLSSSVHTVAARNNISSPADWHDAVPIVCRGWAMSAVVLPGGRRQILSFVLPGDIISTALLFEPTTDRSIVAITEVSYRTFNRAELQMLLSKRPNLLVKLSKMWIEEMAEVAQLAIDLGRRSADERVARLILKLMQRLGMRGMVRNRSMEFPLRQHHIADAMGLSPIHVNRLLVSFRRRGLIEIDRGHLTILNPIELRRIAGL